jgi:hypothetical protein
MNNYPNGPQQDPNQQQPYQQGPPPQGGQPPYPQQPGYPPPGYQQPLIQAPKKKKNKLAIGCGVVAAVIVLFVIIGVANGGKSSTTTTPSSTGGSGNTSSSPAQSKPVTWTTTHTFTGSGIKKTETIAVPADWKIQWSCDPTSFNGANYNVIIGVYNSDATVADIAAINDMCKPGNISGETEERTAGNVYLDVNSEGSWTITIQEPTAVR